jgi:hypothetical protein
MYKVMPAQTLYKSEGDANILRCAPHRSMAGDSRHFRCWHPGSQHYAGGDHLATALLLKWEIDNEVVEERHLIGGSRSVTVYYFTLSRDGVTLVMPVIENPYVIRLIHQLSLHVVAQPLMH